MSESTTRGPLLRWLIKHLADQELPSSRSLHELADVAEWLVPFHLAQSQPLRPAAFAKKMATLSRNLTRAANAADELGEHGMLRVLLESGADNVLETNEPTRIIADLQDWALWSTRAAETARLMSQSAQDHKGGRTPNFRLRSLVTLLWYRYESLLGIKPTHVVDPQTGLGHSKFDLFVKEAIRLYAPEGPTFEARLIDEAINYARPV